MRTLKAKLFAVLFLFAATLTISGCSPPTESDVYVDNTTDADLLFSVDGVAVARIPPGEFRKTSIKLGEHMFVIKQDDKEIFRRDMTLEPAKGMSRRRFLLNPDPDARYCALSFIYGDDTGNAVATEAAVKTVAWFADKEISQGDEKMMEFERLRRDAKPMPEGGWFQVPGGVKVLEPLPAYVTSRNASERRSTLIRVPDQAYDYLVEAAEQKTCIEADIVMMEDVLFLLEELVEVE